MKSEFAFIIASLLALTGCSQHSSDAASPQATASAGAGSVETEASNSSSVTGVPECDDYLAKVKACISQKVPPAQRAQLEHALDQSQSSWASMADKEQLAQACKAASDQAKTTYAAMGCEL